MLRASRILVATDLSDSADEALRQAHAIARASGGKLVACHVLPEALRYQPLFPDRAGDALKELTAAQGTMGDAVATRVAEITGQARSDFEVVVGHGPAGARIVSEAEAHGADLVVVGSRGATGIERFLLGSVAERVVRYAHVPVLVARSSPATDRIVAGTDFSDPSREALAVAKVIAGWWPSQVTLVHAIDVAAPAVVSLAVPLGASWVPVPPEEMAAIREGARAMIDDELERVGLPGTSRVVEARPAAAIVEAARELDARLVVVGTRGRTGLARLTLGSVAESVVRDAPCSVLVTRAGG
jgi:nucleotide-binding universal stress UspA family protein